MGRAWSLLGLVWSKQDLLCPIQVSTGLSRTCSASSSLLSRVLSIFVPVALGRCCMVFRCLEMLHRVSLLGEVSWCFVTGRCCMVFCCCPPQADVLECGITWAAGLRLLWDRLSVLTALNSSRCWLGRKVTLKICFSCPGVFYEICYLQRCHCQVWTWSEIVSLLLLKTNGHLGARFQH